MREQALGGAAGLGCGAGGGPPAGMFSDKELAGPASGVRMARSADLSSSDGSGLSGSKASAHGECDLDRGDAMADGVGGPKRLKVTHTTSLSEEEKTRRRSRPSLATVDPRVATYGRERWEGVSRCPAYPMIMIAHPGPRAPRKRLL